MKKVVARLMPGKTLAQKIADSIAGQPYQFLESDIIPFLTETDENGRPLRDFLYEYAIKAAQAVNTHPDHKKELAEIQGESRTVKAATAVYGMDEFLLSARETFRQPSTMMRGNAIVINLSGLASMDQSNLCTEAEVEHYLHCAADILPIFHFASGLKLNLKCASDGKKIAMVVDRGLNGLSNFQEWDGMDISHLKPHLIQKVLPLATAAGLAYVSALFDEQVFFDENSLPADIYKRVQTQKVSFEPFPESLGGSRFKSKVASWALSDPKNLDLILANKRANLTEVLPVIEQIMCEPLGFYCLSRQVGPSIDLSQSDKTCLNDLRIEDFTAYFKDSAMKVFLEDFFAGKDQYQLASRSAEVLADQLDSSLEVEPDKTQDSAMIETQTHSDSRPKEAKIGGIRGLISKFLGPKETHDLPTDHDESIDAHEPIAAQPSILKRFVSLSDGRPRSDRQVLLRPEFASVYKQAVVCGWDSQLEDLISRKDPRSLGVLSQDAICQALAVQSSPSLLNLVNHEGFTVNLTSGKLKSKDYDGLARLLDVDPALFETEYLNVSDQDSPFIDTITRLIAGYGKSGAIRKTSPAFRAFFRDLGPLDQDDASCFWDLAVDFEAAINSISLGLSPYEGSIESVQDKSGFAHWFAGNRKSIKSKIADVIKVQPYMGEDQSRLLRDELVDLLHSQGNDFCDKYLPSLRDSVSSVTYHRMIALLSKLDSPKELCRHRNILDTVVYKASTLNEGAWEAIKSEIEQSDRVCSYDKFLAKHQVQGVARALQKAGRIEGSSHFIDADKKARGTPYTGLVGRILDLRERRLMSALMCDQLGYAVSQGRFELATLVSSQIELGLEEPIAMQLLSFYASDEELKLAPPAEICTLKSPVQKKEPEAPKKVVREFDYFPLEQYLQQETGGRITLEAIRIILEGGFNLGKTYPFQGSNNYANFGTIYTNIRRKAGGQWNLDESVEKDMTWLLSKKVLKFKSGKGTTIRTGCVMVTSHYGHEHIDAPLSDYLNYVCNGVLPGERLDRDDKE